MIDFRNCYNVDKLIHICENLQNAKKGDCLSLRKSIHGYYPVFTNKTNFLSKNTENIFNKNLPKSQDFRITDFTGQVTPFFTTNARNSLEHKIVSLETLAYLKAVFSNSSKMVNEIKTAVQELKGQKREFHFVDSTNLRIEMRKNQETCDFTIFCLDGEVKAHWCIFSETPFFKFRTGVWKEKANGEKSCDLKEFPLAVVEILVDLLYTIPLKKNIQLDHLLWLYYLTDYLLLNECNEIVKINLKTLFKKDVNNFVEALIYSYKFFYNNSNILNYLYEYDIKWLQNITFKKKKKLVKILAKFAEQSNPFAQNHLGLCYKYGDGVEKDLGKAVELYQMAAELGYASAQTSLALCFRNGDGVQKDLKKAVSLYTQAVEQNHASAQFYLASCYETGSGVQKNLEMAVLFYTQAANQGYAPAQNNLGWFYKKGQGLEKDLKKAVLLYILAVNQGYAPAKNNLAYCYENGDGVQKDLKKAILLYTQAAEQGYAPAQNNLALCYKNGNGVKKDLEMTIKLLTQSANQGCAPAQNNLALCYRNGDGVQRDFKKAFSLVTQAAKQGHAPAQYNLAFCYENGDGVQKDLKKAVLLYTQAAEQGDEDSIKRLAIIKKQQKNLRA